MGLAALCAGAGAFLLGYVLLMPRLYGPTDPMPVAYLPIDGPGFPATTASLLFFATFRHYVASTYTPSKLAGRADAAAPCRAAGLKDERNSHFVACHATSLVHSAVLGVPAICIAVYLYLLPATDCPLEVLYLQSDAIPVEHSDWIRLHNQIKILGHLFEGFCMSDCLFLLVPGSWAVVGGAANAFHHLAFVAVGAVIRTYSCVPGVAIALMAAELSTPFLNAFRIKDALGMDGAVVIACRGCFAVFFFLVRVLLNTWVVYSLFLNRRYLDASAMPPAGQYILLGLLPMLQLLNFFWFFKILQHVISPPAKKTRAE